MIFRIFVLKYFRHLNLYMQENHLVTKVLFEIKKLSFLIVKIIFYKRLSSNFHEFDCFHQYMRFFNCVICSSPKLVDNARLKDIRQTTGLKTAVKGTAIICSSISQCIKTRLNAIFILTGINTVYSYRRLFAGIYFPQSQQKANYLGSY